MREPINLTGVYSFSTPEKAKNQLFSPNGHNHNSYPATQKQIFTLTA